MRKYSLDNLTEDDWEQLKLSIDRGDGAIFSIDLSGPMKHYIKLREIVDLGSKASTEDLELVSFQCIQIIDRLSGLTYYPVYRYLTQSKLTIFKKNVEELLNLHKLMKEAVDAIIKRRIEKLDEKYDTLKIFHLLNLTNRGKFLEKLKPIYQNRKKEEFAYLFLVLNEREIMCCSNKTAFEAFMEYFDPMDIGTLSNFNQLISLYNTTKQADREQMFKFHKNIIIGLL